MELFGKWNIKRQTKFWDYQNQPSLAAVALQEKEKKDKYLRICHKQRKDITPLVYTVDGIAGREAKVAEKKMALYLAAKWNINYSVTVFYVQARIAL